LGSATVALFVFIWQFVSNHGLIRLKDLSRDLQLNCVISFFFRLHLVLHAYAVIFDVTGTVALFGFAFWVGDPTKQAHREASCLLIKIHAIYLHKHIEGLLYI
jgi:hypothetical protein